MGRTEIQVIMRSAKKGYFAHGVFDGKGLTVYKGSQVSDSVRNSIKGNELVMRSMNLDEDGRTVEDRYFKSPSAASDFVCGRSSNGWVEWVTPEGVKLSAYRDIGTGSADHPSKTATPAKPVTAESSTISSHQELPAAVAPVPARKPEDSHRLDGKCGTMKMLFCADIRLGAVSTEQLDVKQSHKWLAARNEKFVDLIDKAAQNNAMYVALFGRLFGQDRVTESVIDTLFKAVRENAGITVLVCLSASEHKRISYRNDIPENLHLINMEMQDSYLDDNVALRIHSGTAELQLGDHDSMNIRKDDAGKFDISGLSEAATIPSFEPVGFEDAQEIKCGYGILAWTEDHLGQFQVKGGAKYAYQAIELKIMPEDDQQEILRKINNAIKGIDPDTFLRITITGRSAFGLTMSSDALKNQLQNRIFFVEVYDNTVMDIDEETFETDISLRSEFVRLALQDGSLSESERNRLISLGWNALSGREVSAE